MTIYRLVTIGEPVSLTLFTAESTDKREAFREIKKWADTNNWVILSPHNSREATCQIQTLTPLN